MSISKHNILEPTKDSRLLSPVDRISEILFGLIMALTFTCTTSVINTDRIEIRDMLISAIGCNIAWGLVDAVMFLLMTMSEKGRGLTILNYVRHSKDIKKAQQFISDALPPAIASLMQPHDLETLRKKLMQTPESKTLHKLKFRDFKTAAGIFVLVFLSTLPVAIPFILIGDIQLALRISNLTAICMMFICGAALGKYSGRNRLFMGLMMSLIGIALVLATISLGG